MKSEIFRPRFYEKVAPSETYTVFGAAWAGESEVAEVSVSTRRRQNLGRGRIPGSGFTLCVARWKSDWVTPSKPCQCTLMSRAKDTSGNAQPNRHDENYGGYVINDFCRMRSSLGTLMRSSPDWTTDLNLCDFASLRDLFSVSSPSLRGLGGLVVKII